MNKKMIGLALLAMLPSVVGLKAADRPEMVRIPAGTFIMGMADDDVYANHAKPRHKVYVSSFYMDKYEVTQGEYRKLLGKNPAATKKNIEITKKLIEDKSFKPICPIIMVGDNYPVVNVSWYDAAKFCNARSRAEGLEPCYDEKTWECDFSKNGYRLPTEAEWEYACRAGSATKYFFGDDKKKLIEYANYWQCSEDFYMAFYGKYGCYDPDVKWDKPASRLLPVGSKKPNKWGLYDMLGNACEWCDDWHVNDYYKKSPKNNPRGPEKGEYKVVRGDSFFSSDAPCGSRGYTPPDARRCYIGFRCVRNAPKDEKKETEKKDVKDKKPGKKSKDIGED